MSHTSTTRVSLLVFFAAAMSVSSLAQEGRTFKVGPHVGLDFDTDATVVGGHIIYDGLLEPLPLMKVEGVLSVGRGKYEYEYDFNFDAASKTADVAFDQEYTVVHLQAHARYPIPISEESPLGAEVFAGPALYRWSANDCPGDCSETEFTIDLGAGVVYRIFGLDAYIRLGGAVPDFSLRAKANLGFGR